jgi:hypothetical protein
VPKAKRFFWISMVVAISIFPESVVLIKYFPQNLPPHWLLLNLLYGISLSLFFFGLLHTTATPVERFVRKSFWIFILLIVLILFKTPLIGIVLLMLVTGYMLYSKNYYLYQPLRDEP